jgi:hypothetical protein
MVVLSLLKSAVKGMGLVGVAVGSFYLGTQYHHRIERMEHGLFSSHLEFSPTSHRGSLGFVDVENDQGQLEKHLKNLETGDTIYAIRPDCLPNNEFVYKGLQGRVESANRAELKGMYEYAAGLEEQIEGRLYPKANEREKQAEEAEREPEQGSSVFTYLSFAGILATIAAAYRKLRPTKN